MVAIFTFLIVAMILAATWAVFSGLVWVICWLVGWHFSWKIATAIWLGLFLIKWLFGKSDSWPAKVWAHRNRPPCGWKRGDAAGRPGHSDSRGFHLMGT